MIVLLESALRCACATVLAVAPTIETRETAPPLTGEAAALAALEAPELELQRAGTAASISLADSERAGLQDLQLQSLELADQRAGELSNESLTTIFLVLGIIAALVIIL